MLRTPAPGYASFRVAAGADRAGRGRDGRAERADPAISSAHHRMGLEHLGFVVQDFDESSIHHRGSSRLSRDIRSDHQAVGFGASIRWRSVSMRSLTRRSAPATSSRALGNSASSLASAPCQRSLIG
jgi:hypothetical protein